MDYRNLLAVAEKAAVLAGNLLRDGFGGTFGIANKEGRHNLVTEFDHRAEKAIIACIHEEISDHNLSASGASGGDSVDSSRY